MIEQVGVVKSRPFVEWFKEGTPKEAIDLVVRMLQFNPAKRPTASEILKNHYLASFSNPREEYDSKNIVKPPISDNTKLGLKDYRALIYEHIRRCYRDHSAHTSLREPPAHNSLHVDSHKQERPMTANKGEKPEPSQHYYRNSSNNAKN
jgi:serine/threonine protein kinase